MRQGAHPAILAWAVAALAAGFLPSCSEEPSDDVSWAPRRPVWGEGFGGSNVGNGISATPTYSEIPRVAVDSQGYPTVAWRETVLPASLIFVKRWNGTAWEELGGSASTGIPGSTNSSCLGLDVDSSGNPVVLWGDEQAVLLRRWSGTSWEELGGSATGDGISASPGLASFGPVLVLDSAGLPFVAWQETIPFEGTDIYLRRWNGSSWVEVGGSATGGGISGTSGIDSAEPLLALDSTGNPVVIWLEQGHQCMLRRWNGASWEELGGSATAGIGDAENSAGTRALALEEAGTPVVAFRLQYTFSLVVKRWNGASWAELGDAVSGTGPFPSIYYNGASCVSMVVDDSDRIVVAGELLSYVNSFQILVKRWNGSSWEEVAGSGGRGGITEHLGGGGDTAMASGGGKPFVVAWRGGTRDPWNPEIYVARSPE